MNLTRLFGIGNPISTKTTVGTPISSKLRGKSFKSNSVVKEQFAVVSKSSKTGRVKSATVKAPNPAAAIRINSERKLKSKAISKEIPLMSKAFRVPTEMNNAIQYGRTIKSRG